MAAGYPTFVLADCRSRKILYVTQSARRAAAALGKGRRIEIWYNGEILRKILFYEADLMQEYIEAEKRHIAEKQKRHEQKNQRRRLRGK